MSGLTPGEGGPSERDRASDAYSRRVQLLQATGHFGGVSHDVLAQVATMLKPLAVPADGIVVHEGEPGDQLFLVEAGTLAVTTDIGGRPRELALLGPGQFFGETALLEQAGRAATVRATTNAQLWALSAEDFQQLRARHPEIETVARQATVQHDATGTGVFEVEQRAIAPGQQIGSIRIGRNPDNEMVFPSDLVSGHHAEIELLGDVARLRDLDSMNGTFVNGHQIRTADLNDGDEIRVGDERFTFDRRAIQASLAPQAPAPAQAQIRIGRASDNDIVFDSRLISAHHAVIESMDGGYRLRDLDSLNGTFVNGARIRSSALNDGDEIWVGDERFIFDRRAIHHTAEPQGIRIDATGLTRDVRGGKRLLNDISMSIVPGEFVAIVGGSGAGKTTLMDAMSGVQPATSGRLLYNGRDYYRNLGFFRNVLGYVPQDDIIHTGLPVRVTLRHAAKLRLPPDTSSAELDQAVDKALAELELTQQADLKVGLLSGGQRKRASIGVELLTEPRVFFLDEPTSGLDPFTDAQMMGLLRRLADNGSTVILTTHATMNVMLCDKVVFLARGGHLAFVGTPQRALEYFEADSFNTIYERLAEEATPEEWSERFRDSADYRQVVSDQLSPAEADAEGGAQGSLGDSGPSVGPGRALRQFRVLSRRSFDLFVHNPSTLPSLVMPPLIFSALALALFGSNVFGSHENSAAALQIVFLITFSAFIFGLLFAVQEIVKEFPIFRRERLVNLGVVPYVLSKTTVLAPLLVLLLIVMVGIMRVTGRLPAAGFELYAKLLLTLVLTAFVGLALALFTSALVSNSQQATDMLSVWIMPQVLFGGALVAVPLMNLVGKIISAVAPVRWSFEAVGHIVDLDSQFNVDTSRIGPGLAIQYTGSFTRDPVQNWLILALFIVVPMALTCVILKRKTTAR
jgi:ABC transport system ATP-binding/permease protein